MGEYEVVMTSVDSGEHARDIARTLVNEHLVACAQMIDITSLYFWEEQLREDPQVLLLLKAPTANYRRIEKRLHELHSDSIPEIVRTPITGGFGPYLQWMDETASGGSTDHSS